MYGEPFKVEMQMRQLSAWRCVIALGQDEVEIQQEFGPIGMMEALPAWVSPM